MSVFFKKQPKIAFRSQEEVTEYWDKEGAHRLSAEEIEKMIRMMVDDLTFRVTTDFFCQHLALDSGQPHVLDAGCGWGRSLIGLKRRHPSIRVTGVDVTPGLLDLGRTITTKIGMEGIDWKQGDVTTLDFPDNTFTHVVSTRVLHYIVDSSRAAAEIVRVLRPGGKAIVMVPNRRNPLIKLGYHTKAYSPIEVAGWFPQEKVVIEEAGSIGFIPPLRLLRRFTVLASLDPVLRNLPFFGQLGGLAFCRVAKVDGNT